MMRLEWTEDAASDLLDILDYQKAKYGMERASRIFAGVSLKVQSLKDFPENGKIVPELSALGISVYRELTEPPWRIIYRIDNQVVYIVSLLDSRRNLEELLYKKVIDGKL